MGGAVRSRLLLQEPLDGRERRAVQQWAAAARDRAADQYDERYGVAPDHTLRYAASTDLAPGGVLTIVAVRGEPDWIARRVGDDLAALLGRPVRYLLDAEPGQHTCAVCGGAIDKRSLICRKCARARGRFGAGSDPKAALEAREAKRAEERRLADLARAAGLA